MTAFIIILLVLAMGATVFALIRGIVAFLRATEADLNGTGPSVSAQKQNKAMMMRITFQGVAVLLVALLLLLGRGS